MRDLLLLIIIFGSIPIILMRPWIGILMWSWVSLMNPHRAAWGIAKTFPVAKVIGLVALVALVFDPKKKMIPWDKSLMLMALLFFMFIVTSFDAWIPDDAFDELVFVFKIFLMAFVSTMLIHGKNRIRIFILVVALSIGFYGIKGGFFSLITGGNFRVYGPEKSFVADNNSMGLALNMVLPLFLFAAREESNRYLRLGLRCGAPLTAIASIFTYSRGALLGLIVVSLFTFPRLKRKGWLLFFVLPVIIFGISKIPEKFFARAETITTYEEDHSALQRLQAWSVALNIAMDEPLTGAGFEFCCKDPYRWLSYSAPEYLKKGYKEARAAHSIYFQILGEHGFIAFFFFILLFIFSIYDLRKTRLHALTIESKKWIANYALPIEIGIWAYMVSGAFLSLAYFDLFYTYIAIAAILKRELHTDIVKQV